MVGNAIKQKRRLWKEQKTGGGKERIWKQPKASPEVYTAKK